MFDVATRSLEFQQNLHLWLIVRHFLSAFELRELCSAVVSITSGGEYDLHDLCTELTVPTDDPISTWVVTITPREGFLRQYLGRFLQTVVWQGDDGAGMHGNEGSVEEVQSVKELEFTLWLSSWDLSSGDLDLKNAALHITLRPFVEQLLGLRSATIDSTAEGSVGGLSKNTPLNALLLKHMGDLCADNDAWSRASSFYRNAQDLLRKCDHPDWQNLRNTAALLIDQSIAAAALILEGPDAALSSLEAIVAPSRELSALAVLNVMPDLMRASSAADPMKFGVDRRGSLVFAPQLIDDRSLLRAFEAWSHKRFSDAHRWFWSVLRRQIAFGSTEGRNDTKGYYGLCILESVEQQQLENRTDTNSFQTAVRLLIESQEFSLVEKYQWKKETISSYVRLEQIQAALDVAESAFNESHLVARQMVLVAIFRAWIDDLPAARMEEAKKIISYFANLAAKHERVFWKDKNIGAYALKSLAAAAKKRPQFRSVDVPAVVNAVMGCLKRRNPLEVGDAIGVADLFRNDFNKTELGEVLSRVLEITESLPAEQGHWPITQPAIKLMSDKDVGGQFGDDTHLGKRMANELLRLTFGNPGEYPNVMFLLRHLKPTIVRENVSQEKMNQVVSTLVERAKQSNSSAAVGAIQALLISPGIAGSVAVNSALDSLAKVIEPSRKRATVAFGEAYYPLINLSQNRAEVQAALNLSAEKMQERLQPIVAAICAIWELAVDEPLIFAAFSIPPQNEPDSTTVHNWSFASASFGHEFNFQHEIDEAVAKARANEKLRAPIDLGRAVFAAGGNGSEFITSEEDDESGEAFYAILGTRLLIATALERDERQKAVRRLTHSCLVYGPDGQDVAVFLKAIELNLAPPHPQITSSYRERLLVNKMLRNSLMPVFEKLIKSKAKD
ncbi:hypothetical protein [Endobacterium cereale]|uniref:hypothetical protein n=1 Tax=Endobacterium cereale TaxID=2663029 RepID=UPI002B45C390|nr:hypothetical protein [Endobacterium cereale]MEB2848100.1 hypothetical protein [Endobacterium cereale]